MITEANAFKIVFQLMYYTNISLWSMTNKTMGQIKKWQSLLKSSKKSSNILRNLIFVF